MIAVLPSEELATPASSADIPSAVIQVHARDWPDLEAQFPEAVMVFAGKMHVAVIGADDWPDISEQFPASKVGGMALWNR